MILKVETANLSMYEIYNKLKLLKYFEVSLYF